VWTKRPNITNTKRDTTCRGVACQAYYIMAVAAAAMTAVNQTTVSPTFQTGVTGVIDPHDILTLAGIISLAIFYTKRKLSLW